MAEHRKLAFGALMGVLVAGGLIAPQAMVAMADEPEKALLNGLDQLFGLKVIDPNMFVKYDVVIDDSVSMDVQRTQQVTKIARGTKSVVTIVTTPTGTYSSDALTSPHVLYPGIDVTGRHEWDDPRFRISRIGPDGYWSITSDGSFTYLSWRRTTRL